MADSQPQQQPAAGGQQPQQQAAGPLRADDILKLQSLPDDEKQKYRLIVQNFWNLMSSHPPGSTEHQTARQKLGEWSQKFIQRERMYRQKMKAQQQGQQQGQAANQGQPSQGNQGAPQQNQNAIKQDPAQALNRPADGADAKPPQAQQPTQSSNDASAAIQKHVESFPYQTPPQGPAPGTPEYDAKIKEFREGYHKLLTKQAGFAEKRKMLIGKIQQQQAAGADVSEMVTMKGRIEKEWNSVKENIDKFRKVQKQWKEDREKQSQGQAAQQPPASAPAPAAAPATAPAQNQQQPQRPQQPAQPVQAQVKEEPQVKQEAGPGQMPPAQPAAQFNMQNNQQQPPQAQNQQMPHQQQQQQQHPARPPPAPHSQSMPMNQGQQFPQGQQQNFPGQPQRPQINPMQANAMGNNSPHPQSANPNGPPVPLTHQAALNISARSYTDPQRVNTPMQPVGQPNFGSREREQMNNPKLPIPRHLNVSSPAPVHMGQARPTMQGPTNGAPGPMGQPVIPRPPPFQLEGEGDRVLSKRKLDELVRQVTGGSEEALTPEVEAAVLQLADDFVDTVITNACRLAKLRESPQLDIRDIQMILERNYNIRIPGYASDEVRTVRKVVPAPGWVAKMNAVSAAKITATHSQT